jgi:hypothetical protein
MSEQKPYVDPNRSRWFQQFIPGKTFAEVGGLWGVVNEQVTVAAKAGAREVAMIDLPAASLPEQPGLWASFRQRCLAHGVANYRCVEADVNDSRIAEIAGTYDVVHCSGVLYHCPQPLATLLQLRKICRETLVLCTATIPDHVVNSAGTLTLEPGSALFIPSMSDAQRAVGARFLQEVGVGAAIGVITPNQGQWRLDNYPPWWWFFTRRHVAALLEVAGFEVREIAGCWYDRATMYLARRNAAVLTRAA